MHDGGDPESIASFNAAYEWFVSDAYPDAQIFSLSENNEWLVSGDYPFASIFSLSEDPIFVSSVLLIEDGTSAVAASAPQILSMTRYLAELGCPPDEAKLTCILDMRCCVGFRAEDTALRDVVDEAIKALISDGTADELALKYGLAADPDEIMDFPEKMGIELNNGVIH